MPSDVRQYVVINASDSRGSKDAPGTILRNCPGVKVVSESVGGTALVEMSQEVFAVISQQFPQLIIEPNVRYRIA